MKLPNHKQATAVFDTGRRGNPLPGCDCVQCFGYCLVDVDRARCESGISRDVPPFDRPER